MILKFGLILFFVSNIANAEVMNVCDRGRIGELLTEVTGSKKCSEVSKKSLEAIVYLDFRSQNIQSMPENAFANLVRLQSLKLRNNEIEDTKALHHPDLRLLRHLDLGQNKISEFAFPSYLSSLETLYLDENALTSISPYSFLGLYNLRTLMLAKNQITEIHPDTFKKMSSLEVLILTGNKLSIVETDTFAGPWFLEVLALENNQISTIEKDAFKNLPRLKELWLAGNKFDRISRAHTGLSSEVEVPDIEVDP